ncbi:MAG: outer membrane beta-barrel protein [Bacteroidota bacterium]
MTRKISIAILSAFISLGAIAQDSSKTTITGSIDAYYRYNFGKAGSSTFNNITSFTNSQNSFELGMASLRVDHSIGKVAGTIDLGFGKRAQEFSYNDGGLTNNTGTLMQAVKQAYISYSPSSKVKFTAGKWGTHVGYEVVDAYVNRNYSMSYMFSKGPFFHTGIKADFTTAGKTTFMVGIANPTDFVSFDNGQKVALAQIATATKDDKIKLWLNYVGTFVKGGGSGQQIDLVATGAVASNFSLGYNGSVYLASDGDNSASSWGSALYFNYDPKANFGLTLRTEYFSDKKNNFFKLVSPILSDDIFAATLSANYKVGAFTLIPEVRMDNGTVDGLFAKSDATATKSTFTALVAAIYKF